MRVRKVFTSPQRLDSYPVLTQQKILNQTILSHQRTSFPQKPTRPRGLHLWVAETDRAFWKLVSQFVSSLPGFHCIAQCRSNKNKRGISLKRRPLCITSGGPVSFCETSTAEFATSRSAVRSRLAPPILPSEINISTATKPPKSASIQCAAALHCSDRLGGLSGDLSRFSRLSRIILRTLRQGGGKY